MRAALEAGIMSRLEAVLGTPAGRVRRVTGAPAHLASFNCDQDTPSTEGWPTPESVEPNTAPRARGQPRSRPAPANAPSPQLSQSQEQPVVAQDRWSLAEVRILNASWGRCWDLKLFNDLGNWDVPPPQPQLHQQAHPRVRWQPSCRGRAQRSLDQE